MPNFGLSENALTIFKTLYCFEGETIAECFRRVAKEFGGGDRNQEDECYRLLAEGVFRPGTPCFFNAGTDHKVFSACFVIDLKDSMDSIYDVANVSRKIFQHGAGVGIPIGNLREGDAPIFEGKTDISPTGKSSGSVSFMKLFDTVGATTKSGGRTRRAAILCAMPVDHPDIMNFIRCKEIDGTLSNMNISVAITDKFMDALEDKVPFTLHTPYDGSDRGIIDPQTIWDEIVKMGHKTADPGVFFIDTVNKYNPLKSICRISASNPCGEQHLAPYLACVLSAVDLRKFIREGVFDFGMLQSTIKTVTRLMDNLIEIMDFPDERFKDMVRKWRPMGIGPMGLADALFELNIAYDSVEGRLFAEKVMMTMTASAIDASVDIAIEHGKLDRWDDIKDDILPIIKEHCGEYDVVYKRAVKYGTRNIQWTTCAPTGTTAISADASYGIEPCFGLVFTKNLIDGTTMHMVNPVFKKFEGHSWYTEDLLSKIVKNGGSLKGLRGIPKEIRETFVVAHDIKPKDRVEMQAGIQKYVSNAISSTVNLPKDATLEEISELYKLAYKLGLKGITIYRDGSKKSQPINFTMLEKKEVDVPTPIKPIKRPKRMPSTSYQMETGNGDMLIDVATHEGRVLQLVLNIGKSGQSMNTLLEALGRVLSIGLQHGVPLQAFVKTMEGIQSDKPSWYRFEDTDKKPAQILSVPDGLAKLLKRYYVDKTVGEEEEILMENEKELCDKCGTYSMVSIEGCKICQNCQYSCCS